LNWNGLVAHFVPVEDPLLASAYQAVLAGRPLAVSLITLAEIEYGMEVKN
jgi:hypothetical protein